LSNYEAKEKTIRRIRENCTSLWENKEPQKTSQYQTQSPCLTPENVALSWSKLFDLTYLEKKGCRYQELSETHFASSVLPLLERQDTHIVIDQYRDSYQLFEGNPKYPLIKYDHALTFSDLLNITQKYLFFGSLFGSNRIVLNDSNAGSKYLPLKLAIENSTIYRHSDIIYNTAENIIADLGGHNAFVAVHARTQDGAFRKRVQGTVKRQVEMIEAYIRYSKGSSPSNPNILIQRPLLKKTKTKTRYNIQNTKPLSLKRLEACLDAASSRFTPRYIKPLEPSNLIIYLATDAKDPLKMFQFQSLFDKFPCVFTLSTFTKYLGPIIHPDKIAPPEEKNLPYPIYRFLLSTLDQIIPSRGSIVLGTKASTFSKYIYRIYSERICGKTYGSSILPKEMAKELNATKMETQCGWTQFL